MLDRILVAALVMIAVPSGADARYDGYVAPVQPTPVMLRGELMDRLSDIRQKGLVQQQADGGQLTPAHREALQADIDAAQTRFANKMRSIGVFPFVSTPQQTDRAVIQD